MRQSEGPITQDKTNDAKLTLMESARISIRSRSELAKRPKAAAKDSE
jgi:hypothetical protein